MGEEKGCFQVRKLYMSVDCSVYVVLIQGLNV